MSSHDGALHPRIFNKLDRFSYILQLFINGQQVMEISFHFKMLTPLYLMTFYFKLVMLDKYFELLRILKSAVLMMELILRYYEY